MINVRLIAKRSMYTGVLLCGAASAEPSNTDTDCIRKVLPTLAAQVAADTSCVLSLVDAKSLIVPEIRRQAATPPSRLPGIGKPVPPFRELQRNNGQWSGSAGSITLGRFALPERFSSVVGDLLSAPMVLDLSQTPLADASFSPSKLIQNEAGGIRWQSDIERLAMRLQIEGTYHFDGLFTMRLDWNASVPGGVVTLQLPLQSSLLRHVARRGPHASDSALPRVIDIDPATPYQFEYTPWLQLSDDRHGFVLLSASQESWGDVRHPISIQYSSGRPILVVAFSLDAPKRSVEIALQPLPLRDERVNPHDTKWLAGQVPDAKPLHARVSRSVASATGVTDFPSHVVVHQGWTDIQGYPGTHDARLFASLQSFIESVHDADAKALLYLGAEASVAMPDFARWLRQIVAIPLRRGRSRGETPALRPHGGSMEWAAHHASLVEALMQDSGADGVFLDMLGDVRPSINRWAGLGYMANDKTLRAEFPWFANRYWLHRLSEAVHRGGRDAVIACHVSGPATPGQGVCDYLLVGEQELAEGRRRGNARYLDLIEPERLRALYNPYRRGLPIQWLVKPSRGGAGMDRVSASTLTLDIPVRTQWPQFIAASAQTSMLNPVADVRRHWALWRSRTAQGLWIAPWEPQPIRWHGTGAPSLSTRTLMHRSRLEVTVSNFTLTDHCGMLQLSTADLALSGLSITQAHHLSEGAALEIQVEGVPVCVSAKDFVVVELTLDSSSP
ncbi:MAG: hypothetical protein AAFR91_10025 [Pseudomonadota bacterium]